MTALKALMLVSATAALTAKASAGLQQPRKVTHISCWCGKAFQIMTSHAAEERLWHQLAAWI